MSSRIGYARPFSLSLFLSLLVLIASSIALLSVPLLPAASLTDRRVVSPQNLNIKIRPALMPLRELSRSPLASRLHPFIRTPRKFRAKCFHKACAATRAVGTTLRCICTRKPHSSNKDRDVPPPCHRCKVGRVARNWRYVRRI